MQPARVGYGTGAAYLNANRDAISRDTRLWTQAANLEGPSDKTLAVVMFTDLNGAPIAAYMNYAMHPIDGFLTGITTADFPGAACRYIGFRSEILFSSVTICFPYNPPHSWSGGWSANQPGRIVLLQFTECSRSSFLSGC